MFNLHSNYGLPLCVSGITHHPTFSKEMVDHDLRREAMRKQRSRASSGLHANQEMGFQGICERLLEEIRKCEIDGDLAGDEGLCDLLLHSGYLSCVAKAA